MDPNAALVTVREQLAAFQGLTDSDVYSDADWDLDALIESVSALDEWLSRGGFLPTSWER